MMGAGVALDLRLTDGGPAPSQPAATEPPEARGLRRDEVRLMIAGEGPLQHRLFTDLGRHLEAGDLLVVNTSATLPAALDGRREDGTAVTLHVSGPARGHGRRWVVELRRPSGGRVADAVTGERVELPGGVTAQLRAAYPDPAQPSGSRLWEAAIPVPDTLEQLLHRHGRPITYDYLAGRWPLTAYQTIFAAHPGSAEMPSAGRPFSPELVVDLVRHGVVLAPVTLHTGVSSLEAGESPLPERYRVPQSTADLVAVTRAAGRRVIAVGTTVTRALETVARSDGTVTAGEGWTDLVLGAQRPARVVDGLITGWHDADASHLQLLEAVAGGELVAAAYAAAGAERYRWHEFGDACLLLAGT